MSLSGRLFRFFIYSNLFITCCVILMVWQTYALLLHSPFPDFNFLWYAAFATLCSYSFHWHLTPHIELDSSRLRWLKRNRYVHVIFFCIGLIGAAYYGIILIKHWPWLLLSAFITFLYSAPKIPHPLFRLLRKVALGKTIFLAFVWMYVTTILPLQISNQPWETNFYLFAASRFFLIYSICILFDYRDREYDRSIGIRSLITWLSEGWILAIFIFSLLVFAVCTLLMKHYGYYNNIVIINLLIPGVITAALYRNATRNFSDILYYFVLDGLMAFSAMLTVIEIMF